MSDIVNRVLRTGKSLWGAATQGRPLRKVGLAAALVLGLAGVVGLFTQSATSVSGSKPSDASRKVPLEKNASAVGALGRIEPHSEVVHVGSAIDDRLARLIVAEGDLVKEGQILGYLESHRERVSDRDRIAAQLQEAERMLEAETRLGQAAVREAELAMRRIKEVGEPRVSGQRTKVQSLTAELTNNKDILGSREQLFASGSGARRSLDDQRTVVIRNQESLKFEGKELERLQTEIEVDRLMAQAKLDRVHAELARAQAAIGVESLRQQLAVAEARIALAQVSAPIAGRILKVMLRPGSRIGGAPILRMGDTSEMHAVAEVYETDIGRIKLGQSATVRSRALANPLTGNVVKIGKMIYKNDVLDVDPAAKVDARVVEVRIRLNEPEVAENLTNLSVDVVIDTAGATSAAASAAQ